MDDVTVELNQAMLLCPKVEHHIEAAGCPCNWRTTDFHNGSVIAESIAPGQQILFSWREIFSVDPEPCSVHPDIFDARTGNSKQELRTFLPQAGVEI
jgi:hypothetical protein